MTKFLPILLALAYGYITWRLSVWRTRSELDRRSTPLDAPEIGAQVARLALAQGVPRIPVMVYEIDAVNGLASLDGRIFLTRGFLRRYETGEVSAAELASVVAHELGHVALGHTRRRSIDFAGQNAVFMLLTVTMARFIPFVGPWIAGLVTTLVAARLSRADEFEADRYATALLMKSGIGAAPQVSLFEKLGDLTGTGSARSPAWLMSHPDPRDRITAIRENARRWAGTHAPA